MPAGVVFVHGLRTSATMWRHQVAALEARGTRAVAIDLPGHGDSDVTSAAQSIADMAASVREFVDALGGSRVVLVGCSMGSAVAATVAAAAPPNVKALVLSNSSFGHSPERFAALSKRSTEARNGFIEIGLDM